MYNNWTKNEDMTYWNLNPNKFSLSHNWDICSLKCVHLKYETEVHDIVQETGSRPSPRKRNAKK